MKPLKRESLEILLILRRDILLKLSEIDRTINGQINKVVQAANKYTSQKRLIESDENDSLLNNQ